MERQAWARERQPRLSCGRSLGGSRKSSCDLVPCLVEGDAADRDEGVGDGEGERQQADEVQRGADEQQQQRRQRRRELEPLLINYSHPNELID